MRQATLEEIKALPYFDNKLSLFFTTSEDKFMEMAYKFRQDSTDKKHPTGAVVIKNDIVLSSGCNKSGFKHMFFIRLHENGLCFRRWLKIPSGQKYWICPGCSKSYQHAESRVSREAFKKHGVEVLGSTLYLAGHFWCCKSCCDEMIKAGIKNVILVEGAKNKFSR